MLLTVVRLDFKLYIGFIMQKSDGVGPRVPQMDRQYVGGGE